MDDECKPAVEFVKATSLVKFTLVLGIGEVNRNLLRYDLEEDEILPVERTLHERSIQNNQADKP